MKKILLILIIILAAGSIFFMTRQADISPSQNTPPATNSVNAPGNKNQPPASNTGNDVSGKTLDISDKGLTTLTAEFFNDNPGTVILDVSDNKLTGALPAEIRKMTGLKAVRASHNQLTGIPAEIGQLSQLQELDFSYNQINTYPNEIANLKNNLQVFKLTGNTFTAGQIAELRALLPETTIEF
ncbi:MAG TPA: hypothetical protein P5267_00145 [Patescibacteria group bacterium]|nr:hypothetical protein [Patescibacteria group bacterium]